MDDTAQRGGEPTPDAEALIVKPLPCSRCGYDLRGLAVSGVCPECAQPVGESVLAAVDPAARRLPRLRDPRGVGDGLVLLMSCLAAGTLLLAAEPLAARLAPLGGILGAIGRSVPDFLPLAAGIILLAGLLAVMKLAPPRGSETSRAIGRHLGLISLGLSAAAGAAFVTWWLEPAPPPGVVRRTVVPIPEWVPALVALAGAGVLIMAGLRGVMRVIGERSREYRMAHGGRQRAIDMIATLLAMAIAAAVRGFGDSRNLAQVSTLATVALWICTLMLVVGIGYLLLNTIWIRRSLRRPPPAIRDLIGTSDDLTTVIELRDPDE